MRPPRLFLALALLAAWGSAGLTAAGDRVIAYGADLTPEEKVSVVRDFGLPSEVDPGQITSITVTHGEEVALLGRVATPQVLGSMAISSVYLQGQAVGTGLLVSTKNVNWVTPAMYANAMVTGGVRDAKVVVTAPVMVSGTAALTGIFKSFSHLSGRTLSPAAEAAAADELVRTGELGQTVGQDKAVSFMSQVKTEVIRGRPDTYEAAQTLVERVAREQGLTLSDRQVRSVTDVVIRISKLDLNLNQIQTQLKNFTAPVEPAAGGIQSLIAKVIAFFQSLFKQIVGFVGRAIHLG